MNIVAEVKGNEVVIFIECLNWKKVTRPFNKEKVNVELTVTFIDGKSHFHDAVTKPVAETTHDLLSFCKRQLTVAEFKRLFRKNIKAEPYELRLRGHQFHLRKAFTEAYTITFFDYQVNEVFKDWLVMAMPVLEAASLIKRLKAGQRYYSKEFSGFREFNNIAEFTRHRFELWHDKMVNEFEAGNGRA